MQLVEKNIIETSKKWNTKEMQLYRSILEANQDANAFVTSDKPKEEGFVEVLDLPPPEKQRVPIEACIGVCDEISVLLLRLDMALDSETSLEHQHGLVSGCRSLIKDMKKKLTID